MPLSRTDIIAAFTALADVLDRRQSRAEIVIAGGAALVLLYGARETTKDVDAYFVVANGPAIRDAVREVADGRDLPHDWLNDGAKGYFVGVTAGQTVYESSALIVKAASTAQLLAMKLAAWRDAVDRADARLLLSQMNGTAEAIWREVEPFVPRPQLDKASYAFDDLWETTHGPR